MGKESITRRFLPHRYMPGAAHFVTYRLFDSIPRAVLDELQARKLYLLNQKPPPGLCPTEHRERVHKQYHHHTHKYFLHAYCVMPNHVHVLFQPIDPPEELPHKTVPPADSLAADSVGETSDHLSPLAVIMHSLKSYTAHEANKVLGRSGTFWQVESYDHWVRDEDELERIVNYIRANPVKAGLVKRPEDWYFSSCHDRLLRDGDTSGWLPS